ncbi:MAG: OmpA family protein [Planctomycetota bacterium]|nr:OmpA family protein [Planctomycetota bacterium]
MKLSQVTCTGALALACLFFSTGCVTQRNYDDLSVSLKRAQQDLYERDARIVELQNSLATAKKSGAAMDVARLQDAGMDGDFDQRISELQAKIDGLGHPLGDIERIDVEGGYVLVVQDKILFDSGSADLSGDGKKALDKVAGEIEAQPHGRIWVRGHTDSDRVSKPSTKERFPHGNLQLSTARAVEVAAQLNSSTKVKASDVVVVGYGQYAPLRPNDSAENKRLNRRVEIFVSDKNASSAVPAAAKK